MSNLGIVLIHGGTFTSGYWDWVVPLLESECIAVDLPGRGRKPADLDSITISDWAESVIDDIGLAGFDEAVLVGNSLAGITIPAVARRIPERMRHLVFSSCTVPSQGQRVLDCLQPELGEMLEQLEPMLREGKLPEEMRPTNENVSAAACIGADAPAELLRATDEAHRRIASESLGVMFEPMEWGGFPSEVPRTYIKNLRDEIVPPVLQQKMIDGMGGARVIELDGPHCPAIRSPQIIAAILNGIAAGIQLDRT